jgi:hypothetical protein
MKKNLFLISVAALAFAACSNDTTVEQNTTVNQPKEIAFSPLVQPNTRAAVDGTTFTPTTMQVAAWDVTNSRDFFTATTFTKDATTWKGGKYWPFSAAYINFLAYTGLDLNVVGNSQSWDILDDETSQAASGVTLVMANNSSTQNDLMYAIGHGEVTFNSSTNALGFPANVPMTFMHAQAWVKFTVKAGDETSASAITVNSITLNSVSCAGTYTVTHTNYNATSGQSVAGVWSEYAIGEGNYPAVAASGYSALTTSVQDYASLMVVPNKGMASFTINYTLDGNTYNYTYTPASTTLAQAYKYTYNITLTVHEIEIAPSVTNWTEGGPTAVNL